MRATKRRLRASVDANLLVAARSAAEHGEVASVSAWVNEAMRLKVEHDGGAAVLARVIADFEAEHGQITMDEIDKAMSVARSRAVAVGRTDVAQVASWSRARPRRRRQ